MFYVPGSPMDEDEDEEAAGQGDEGKEDAPKDIEELDGCQLLEHLDKLNGEEDSDNEASLDAGSELEDKCSEFRYGDLEEHIIEDEEEDNNEDDGGGDDSKIDLGAEDGEGAADNEEDYDEYREY
ncbi:hypothetical protein BDR04DRAFT_1116659 [Suillus decipiens]|nr:hypothetical protein BDR04DRAFT_1116659 [Suillus decipiens]